MAKHVMLDLETMGTNFNALVCSIGAVKFNPDGDVLQEFDDTFYCTIDAKDAVSYGLVIEQSTIDWWKLQNPEALKELRKNTVPLKTALIDFATWFGPKSMPTWGNGADFDCVIMDSAYRAVELKRPWTPWDTRCYRTMKNVIGVKPPKREGVYHNALDDAKFQARHLLSIFKS